MKTNYRLEKLHDLHIYRPDPTLEPICSAKCNEDHIWLTVPMARLVYTSKNHVLYLLKKKYYIG